MKVTMAIDCTPEEAREFFGLPDVKPIQNAIMARLEKQALDAASMSSPETFMKLWPTLMPQMPDSVQKAMANFLGPFGKKPSGSK